MRCQRLPTNCQQVIGLLALSSQLGGGSLESLIATIVIGSKTVKMRVFAADEQLIAADKRD